MENEIDLLELGRMLWNARKSILKVTVIFAALGLFIAIFSAKEYTSSVTMVPQLSDSKSKAGGLVGLAAMAGVNLGDMGSNDALSPTIYPTIMKSVIFKKELMQTLVTFDNISKPISLYDYYTNNSYEPFSLFSFIAKYTIGLPGVILKLIKGDAVLPLDTVKIGSCLRQSQEESMVADILDSKVSLEVNGKDGILTLTANMPEATVSTQVVEATRVLLQKYITDFKVDKVKQNLDFINERYIEAKLKFEEKQRQIAVFRDGNRHVVLALGGTQEELLNSEYNLCYGVYSELAKQLEQAKIKVKETQPILTVVEPAVVPLQKSKPNRPLIIIGFVFIGLFGSIVWSLVKGITGKLKKIIINE